MAEKRDGGFGVKNFLSGYANQASSPLESKGEWLCIRCEPDPFTGERINVGVGVIDVSGKRHVKVIQEPGRLECFYGELAGQVVSLAQVAAECFLSGIGSPSSQISFADPVPFFEGTVQETLDSAFRDQVTVAIPTRSDSQRNTIDDQQAQNLVIDEIKKINDFDGDLLANTPQVIIQTERGPRVVMIPLQPVNGVGTIKSTDYSSHTLKSHLLDGLLDLECAARYRRKKELGIFLLRPKASSEKMERQIDQVIDSISFRAPANLYLEVQEQSVELAKAVKDWALKAG
jgi:hypothetical protein